MKKRVLFYVFMIIFWILAMYFKIDCTLLNYTYSFCSVMNIIIKYSILLFIGLIVYEFYSFVRTGVKE